MARPAWWVWASMWTSRGPAAGATATSLAIAARQSGTEPPSRTAVIATVLAAFELLYGRWEAQAGRDASLATAYAERCTTLGRPVRVLLSDNAAWRV